MDIKIDKDLTFTSEGPTLKLNIEACVGGYGEFKCFELPESCVKCPAVFAASGSRGVPCGRNIPFKPEDYDSRPSTCKLTQIDVNEIFREVVKTLTPAPKEMTRDAMITYLRNHPEVNMTHKLFAEGEYIYINPDDGKCYDERGLCFESFNPTDTWANGLRIRQGGEWENGWKVYEG